MNDNLIQLALWGFLLMVFLSYLIASAILVYHIITFGLNRRTAIASSVVYLVGSGLIIALLVYQIGFISLSFSLPL